MGYDFVCYRGKNFGANDGILEIWLYFIVKVMDSEPNPSEWLQELKNHWEAQYMYPIPGVVSVELDRFADTDFHRSEILRFCERAYLELIEIKILTREWRNETRIGGESASGYADLETEKITQVGRQFMDLLQQSA